MFGGMISNVDPVTVYNIVKDISQGMEMYQTGVHDYLFKRNVAINSFCPVKRAQTSDTGPYLSVNLKHCPCRSPLISIYQYPLVTI